MKPMLRVVRNRPRSGPVLGAASSHRYSATHLLRAEVSRAIDVSHAVHVARDAGIVALCYVASLPFTAVLLTGIVLPPSFLLPTAILLVALMVTPVNHWWAIIAATFVAHWAAAAANTNPLAAVPGFAMSAFCALVSAWLARKIIDLSSGLGSMRSMGSFMMIAFIAPVICVLGPAIVFRIRRLPNFAASASGGVLALDWTPWFVAALGIVLAFVTIVPAVLAGFEAIKVALANLPRAVMPWTRLIEAVALTAAVAVSSLVAFDGRPFTEPQALVLIAPLSLVLCATLRFGLAGAAVTFLTVALIAVNGIVTGDGPGAFGSNAAGVVLLQTALLAVGTPLLLLGASMDERQRAWRRVARSDDRYAIAAQAGRAFLVSYNPGTGAMEADLFPGSVFERRAFAFDQPDSWWRYVHADDVAPLRARLSARPMLGSGAPGNTDFRMVEEGGRVHWFRMKELVPRVVAGESRMVAAMVDITDLKTAELAVDQRTRELSHVARTAVVGELAAALAHEIRQPLTAILINSQTALRLIESQPSRDLEGIRDILQQLVSDGRRAGEVIQRMRTFASKNEVPRGLIDLNSVVREAAQLVRHDTIRRRTEIRFALSDDPLVVFGDRVQLQQVVLNIVLNALEAVDQSPQSSRLVTIESSRAAQHTALLTVRDTGPGVPEDRLESIFAPFVTTKQNGMGMGLAISRTIVEAHGGVAWCESDRRVGGASIMVAIPLSPARPR
jgi:two-component system, LuxR family, sensor kinase FixL